MTGKVLTPAEVAEISRDFYMTPKRLFESHEAQRATITRLRGLIEGMGHEDMCPQHGLIACLNSAEEECEWLFSGCTRHSKEKFACDCIQSKVNL